MIRIPMPMRPRANSFTIDRALMSGDPRLGASMVAAMQGGDRISLEFYRAPSLTIRISYCHSFLAMIMKI